MVNAQEWLNQHYPNWVRNEIKNLDIREKNLEDSLDLKDFVNLEKLDCSENKLKILDITGLKQLETHVEQPVNKI